jgi:hypothetical protein
LNAWFCVDAATLQLTARYVRDLQIIKIPFMMSSNFKTGGIEDEDIGTGSEWRILTDGGLGYSFG